MWILFIRDNDSYKMNVGTSINVETGKWTNTDSHVSSEIDSYYEYLLKSAILFDDLDCRMMWVDSIASINKYLADEPGRELWYGHSDMNTGKRTATTSGALDAFFPAVLALDGDLNRARVLQDSMTTGFLLWVLVVVLREVFRAATTERDAVLGALCGFVLILMVFMRLHGLLEALTPGAYQANGPPLSACSDMMLVAIFQYFSTVTLTTVGFGDIVPVTPAARLATGLEAIVGQLYLAVVIATLVGRVAARRG